MSTVKLISSVLAGAAAGALLGILLAPDKGSETRRKIAQKSNDLTDNVKDKFSKMGDTISNKYQQVKSEANEMKEKMASAKEGYQSSEKSF